MNIFKFTYLMALIFSIQDSYSVVSKAGSESYSGVELSDELKELTAQEKALDAHIKQATYSPEDKAELMKRYLDDSKKLADIELALHRTEHTVSRYEQLYDSLKAKLAQDGDRIHTIMHEPDLNVNLKTTNVLKGQGYDSVKGVAKYRKSGLTAEERANFAQGVHQSTGGPIITTTVSRGVHQSTGGPVITAGAPTAAVVRKGESAPGVMRRSPLTAEEKANFAQGVSR